MPTLPPEEIERIGEYIADRVAFIDQLGEAAVEQMLDLHAPLIVCGMMCSVESGLFCVEQILLGEDQLQATLTKIGWVVDEIEKALKSLRKGKADQTAAHWKRETQKVLKSITQRLNDTGEECAWP